MYAFMAVALALVLMLPVAIVGHSLDNQGRALARQDASRAADEKILKDYVLRLTIDEALLHEVVDQNRSSINNNSAQLGTNKLAIGDLRSIIAQTKAEVIRQIDGLASVGLPTPTDTVAAKLIALLQRLDRLEARVAALEAAASSPQAAPRPTPAEAPARSPRAEPGPRPAPSPEEYCIVQHVAFCASARP